jgi:hypothetical protein
MPGHDEVMLYQQVTSLPWRVPEVSVKNTFIDFTEAGDNSQGANLGAKSCPPKHFAGVMAASKSAAVSAGVDTPTGDASETLAAMLMGISTPTGSQSLDLLNAFGRELREQPCKVGDFMIEMSTPTGSQSFDFLSAFDLEHVLQSSQESSPKQAILARDPPSKIGGVFQSVPAFELPRSATRVKNTFVEFEDDEDCVKKDRYGLKTCPPLDFHGARVHDSEPMKVELPDDFLDADTLITYRASSPNDVPSIGSVQHGTGSCQPCAWFWKPGGCLHGQACQRCHLCPRQAIREQKKAKRAARQCAVSESDEGAAVRPSYTDHMSETSTSVGSESDVEPGHPNTDVSDSIATSETQAEAPTKGSAFHQAGTCEPCAWFWKPEGCRWGQNCVRCHLCPQGETKARRKLKVAGARGTADRR